LLSCVLLEDIVPSLEKLDIVNIRPAVEHNMNNFARVHVMFYGRPYIVILALRRQGMLSQSPSPVLLNDPIRAPNLVMLTGTIEYGDVIVANDYGASNSLTSCTLFSA